MVIFLKNVASALIIIFFDKKIGKSSTFENLQKLMKQYFSGEKKRFHLFKNQKPSLQRWEGTNYSVGSRSPCSFLSPVENLSQEASIQHEMYKLIKLKFQVIWRVERMKMKNLLTLFIKVKLETRSIFKSLESFENKVRKPPIIFREEVNSTIASTGKQKSEAPAYFNFSVEGEESPSGVHPQMEPNNENKSNS